MPPALLLESTAKLATKLLLVDAIEVEERSLRALLCRAVLLNGVRTFGFGFVLTIWWRRRYAPAS